MSARPGIIPVIVDHPGWGRRPRNRAAWLGVAASLRGGYYPRVNGGFYWALVELLYLKGALKGKRGRGGREAGAGGKP